MLYGLIPTSGSAGLGLSGGTLTGPLLFSGTTQAGIALNNLTTTQRDALSGPATGSLIWNTTTTKPDIYDGANWLQVPTYNAGTITTAQPFTITQTPNASGVTFTHFLMNVGNTSAAASLLMDLQVASSSKFKVRKDGALFLSGMSVGTMYLNSLTLNINSPASGNVNIGVNDNWGLNVKPGGVVIGNTTDYLGWGGSGTADTFLYRDGAANTLAQRNGTTAQKFSLYNTWTDASNYERLSAYWSANVFWLTPEVAGTGQTDRTLVVSGGGTLVLASDLTSRWSVVKTTGHFLAATDNTYDIGASGATRPRNVYVAGTINVATGLTSSSASADITSGRYFIAGNAGGFAWASRNAILAPVDGVVRMTKADVSSAAALMLGYQAVSALPSASTYAGAIALVSDASATTIRSTVSGSGSNKVMVFSDGTNWLIAA